MVIGTRRRGERSNTTHEIHIMKEAKPVLALSFDSVMRSVESSSLSVSRTLLIHLSHLPTMETELLSLRDAPPPENT
jgi:hypothetical protein